MNITHAFAVILFGSYEKGEFFFNFPLERGGRIGVQKEIRYSFCVPGCTSLCKLIDAENQGGVVEKRKTPFQLRMSESPSLMSSELQAEIDLKFSATRSYSHSYKDICRGAFSPSLELLYGDSQREYGTWKRLSSDRANTYCFKAASMSLCLGGLFLRPLPFGCGLAADQAFIIGSCVVRELIKVFGLVTGSTEPTGQFCGLVF